MALASGSMDSANKIGERGHPCLVPLEIKNSAELYPLVLTHALWDCFEEFSKNYDQTPSNVAAIASTVVPANQKLFRYPTIEEGAGHCRF